MTRIRVVSHVHSDWSYDGSFALDEIAVAFAKRGYRAVLLAEHDRGFDAARWSAYRAACAQASTSEIVLIPGIEYSDPTNTVHVPVWGDLPFLGEGLSTGDMLGEARARGGVAILAHPTRRDALGRFDPSWLSLLVGVELWNRKYDGYAPSRQSADLIAARPDLLPFVSLDFHTRRQFHPLAMMVDLDGRVSEAGVCSALQARRAHPRAFGLPARHLTTGLAWPAICGLERTRRRVAVPVRRARALRQGGR